MSTDAGMGGFAGLMGLLSFAKSDDMYACEPPDLQLRMMRGVCVQRLRPLQLVVVTGRRVFSTAHFRFAKRRTGGIQTHPEVHWLRTSVAGSSGCVFSPVGSTATHCGSWHSSLQGQVIVTAGFECNKPRRQGGTWRAESSVPLRRSG